MHNRQFIKGKFLDQIVEERMFDISKIEEVSKVVVDYKGLDKISEGYTIITKSPKTIVEGDKIHLAVEDKAEIIMQVIKKLLNDLTNSNTELFIRKSTLLDKITDIIETLKNSESIDPDYWLTLIKNKRVRYWVLNVLKEKNIISIETIKKDKVCINKDNMADYLQDIEVDYQICKDEICKIDFDKKN